MANLYSIDLEASSTQSGSTATTTLTDGLTTMTLEIWFKPESLNAYRPLLTKGSGGVGRWLMEYENDSDKIFFISNATGKAASAPTAQLSNGVWSHIAMVYDGSQADANKVIFYINGLAVTTTVDAGFDASIPTGTRSINVGLSIVPNYADGLIDEVRIWNTARSASQISVNYQRELVGNESGLILYYKFSEGSGTNVDDLTSSNLDLTLANTPAWSSDVPFADTTTTSTSTTTTTTSTSTTTTTTSTSTTTTTTSTSSSTSTSTSTTMTVTTTSTTTTTTSTTTTTTSTSTSTSSSTSTSTIDDYQISVEKDNIRPMRVEFY